MDCLGEEPDKLSRYDTFIVKGSPFNLTLKFTENEFKIDRFFKKFFDILITIFQNASVMVYLKNKIALIFLKVSCNILDMNFYEMNSVTLSWRICSGS